MCKTEGTACVKTVGTFAALRLKGPAHSEQPCRKHFLVPLAQAKCTSPPDLRPQAPPPPAPLLLVHSSLVWSLGIDGTSYVTLDE